MSVRRRAPSLLLVVVGSSLGAPFVHARRGGSAARGAEGRGGDSATGSERLSAVQVFAGPAPAAKYDGWQGCK